MSEYSNSIKHLMSIYFNADGVYISHEIIIIEHMRAVRRIPFNSVSFLLKVCVKAIQYINCRETRRSNQEWTIYRQLLHWTKYKNCTQKEYTQNKNRPGKRRATHNPTSMMNA